MSDSQLARRAKMISARRELLSLVDHIMMNHLLFGITYCYDSTLDNSCSSIGNLFKVRNIFNCNCNFLTTETCLKYSFSLHVLSFVSRTLPKMYYGYERGLESDTFWLRNMWTPLYLAVLSCQCILERAKETVAGNVVQRRNTYRTTKIYISSLEHYNMSRTTVYQDIH